MSNLLEFYGEECPHCQRMRVLTDEIEKEHNVVIERVEVWHNKENEARMLECDKELCGGVPFFYNTENDKWLCGEVTKEELTAWATEE
jgi:thiol-disulfide isomerase/thioredoxin